MVLDPHRWAELRRFRGLLASGAMSVSEIVRVTGVDRKTVRKYLSAPGPVLPPSRLPSGRSRARLIDPFAPLVDAMLWAEPTMKSSVIHERLVRDYGFPGSYQRVKLYVQDARVRIAGELGLAPGELAGMHRRFEVIPGAQAQVDWGDEGRILAHVGIAKVYSFPHDPVLLP
jgi:transposase